MLKRRRCLGATVRSINSGIVISSRQVSLIVSQWLGLFALTLFLGVHFVATRAKSASGRKSRNALVVQESLEARVRVEKRGRKKKKKVPIVPTGKKSKKGTGEKLGKGLVKQYKVAQTLLEKSADLTKGATNSVNRLIKSWLSSDFEKLLLSLTSPDDLRPQSRDVAEFLATVKSFMIDEDTSPLNEDNPYRVCLRKLNSKVCEPDGRTTLKALYVLHLVSRTPRAGCSFVQGSLQEDEEGAAR